MAAPFQNANRQGPIHRVVLRQQNAQILRSGTGSRGFGSNRSLPGRELRREMECASRYGPSGFRIQPGAFDPDPAMHHLDEFGADRQAQPRPAVFPRGGVVLLFEWSENGVLFLGTNPDTGIGHHEFQRHRLSIAGFEPDLDPNFSRRRKLDGIPHQVQNHLLQSLIVPSHESGDAGSHVETEPQPFLPGAHIESPQHIAHGLFHFEVHHHEIQFPGLYLREVQNVIQQREQRMGGFLHGLQAFPLVGVRGFLQRQFRHPHDRVHGRPDLVAHVGQEPALVVAGGFGRQSRQVEVHDEPASLTIIRDGQQHQGHDDRGAGGADQDESGLPVPRRHHRELERAGRRLHIAVAVHAAEAEAVASWRQAVVSGRGFRGEGRPTAGIQRIGIQQPVRRGELPPVGSGQ